MWKKTGTKKVLSLKGFLLKKIGCCVFYISRFMSVFTSVFTLVISRLYFLDLK